MNFINNRSKKGEKSVVLLAEIINVCESDTMELGTTEDTNQLDSEITDIEADNFKKKLHTIEKSSQTTKTTLCFQLMNLIKT